MPIIERTGTMTSESVKQYENNELYKNDASVVFCKDFNNVELVKIIQEENILQFSKDYNRICLIDNGKFSPPPSVNDGSEKKLAESKLSNWSHDDAVKNKIAYSLNQSVGNVLSEYINKVKVNDDILKNIFGDKQSNVTIYLSTMFNMVMNSVLIKNDNVFSCQFIADIPCIIDIVAGEPYKVFFLNDDKLMIHEDLQELCKKHIGENVVIYNLNNAKNYIKILIDKGIFKNNLISFKAESKLQFEKNESAKFSYAYQISYNNNIFKYEEQNAIPSVNSVEKDRSQDPTVLACVLGGEIKLAFYMAWLNIRDAAKSVSDGIENAFASLGRLTSGNVSGGAKDNDIKNNEANKPYEFAKPFENEGYVAFKKKINNKLSNDLTTSKQEPSKQIVVELPTSQPQPNPDPKDDGKNKHEITPFLDVKKETAKYEREENTKIDEQNTVYSPRINQEKKKPETPRNPK